MAQCIKTQPSERRPESERSHEVIVLPRVKQVMAIWCLDDGNAVANNVHGNLERLPTTESDTWQEVIAAVSAPQVQLVDECVSFLSVDGAASLVTDRMIHGG